MEDDEKIQFQYLDPPIPELGTKLYAWGCISTYEMTKEECMELFGNVLTETSDEQPR